MAARRRTNQHDGASRERHMTTSVRFGLNGHPASLESSGNTSLLWALRTQAGLTGTKYGCGEGACGACVVVVDGRAVRSCTTALEEVAGKEVLTVEGLATGGKLHPLQQAFVDHGALQCGYCTPGMLLSAYALLRERPAATAAEVVAQMNGQLCRCGAHQRIVDAIETAAARMGARS
jgi:aerobic-type carbon monoxide dehydrogenase small subunit (CoxS/CutS family)